MPRARGWRKAASQRSVPHAKLTPWRRGPQIRRPVAPVDLRHAVLNALSRDDTPVLGFDLVIAALAYAVWSRSVWLVRERFVLAAGVAFPVLVLSVLLLYVYTAGKRLHADPVAHLRIEVTAEQWWWRVRYSGFETANEIRIPAGRPVELVLLSADVIHSFWVPGLAGKVDMIPGRENRLVLTATGEGTYRGQCAEFCGFQHARMAFLVVAEPPARFTAWLERQRTGNPVVAAVVRDAIEQIALTYDYTNKPAAEDIFTDAFLPPAAERMLN